MAIVYARMQGHKTQNPTLVGICNSLAKPPLKTMKTSETGMVGKVTTTMNHTPLQTMKNQLTR